MRWWVLLLFPVMAWATGTPTPPPDPPPPTQDQRQDQFQEQTQRQDQTQHQDQSQTQSLHVEGSSAAAEIHAGDNALTFEDSSTSVVSTNYKRQAPSVSVISSPSTAQFMVCFGLGGSAQEGAATGAYCRIEKTLYAAHVAKELAAMGLYGPAAEAYCVSKHHYRAFDDKADCEVKYAAALIPPPPAPAMVAHAEDAELQAQIEAQTRLIRELEAQMDRVEKANAQERARQNKAYQDRKDRDEEWLKDLEAHEQKVRQRYE